MVRLSYLALILTGHQLRIWQFFLDTVLISFDEDFFQWDAITTFAGSDQSGSAVMAPAIVTSLWNPTERDNVVYVADQATETIV